MSAAAAKSFQSCLTLCEPIDGSPPGSPVPGILQARVLEWGAIAFSKLNVYLAIIPLPSFSVNRMSILLGMTSIQFLCYSQYLTWSWSFLLTIFSHHFWIRPIAPYVLIQSVFLVSYPIPSLCLAMRMCWQLPQYIQYSHIVSLAQAVLSPHWMQSSSFFSW